VCLCEFVHVYMFVCVCVHTMMRVFLLAILAKCVIICLSCVYMFMSVYVYMYVCVCVHDDVDFFIGDLSAVCL